MRDTVQSPSPERPRSSKGIVTGLKTLPAKNQEHFLASATKAIMQNTGKQLAMSVKRKVITTLSRIYIEKAKPMLTDDKFMPMPLRRAIHDVTDSFWMVLMSELPETIDNMLDAVKQNTILGTGVRYRPMLHLNDLVRADQSEKQKPSGLQSVATFAADHFAQLGKILAGNSPNGDRRQPAERQHRATSDPGPECRQDSYTALGRTASHIRPRLGVVSADVQYAEDELDSSSSANSGAEEEEVYADDSESMHQSRPRLGAISIEGLQAISTLPSTPPSAPPSPPEDADDSCRSLSDLPALQDPNAPQLADEQITVMLDIV